MRRLIPSTTPAGAPYGSDLAALVRLVKRGRLHPETGSVTGRAETPGTLVALRERRIRGKAVLVTGGTR
ncbi:hypothetical protein ACFWFZ_03480 [Streptomyces sp. NPDC060232]|uniref:hypothetical protein n=1 Tax=Streptomyces sp. NPDC060232 TaxID=3347079 RepID=UPI003653A52E